jgi:hypothetical protein
MAGVALTYGMPYSPLDERTDKQHVFSLLINLHHSLTEYTVHGRTSLVATTAHDLKRQLVVEHLHRLQRQVPHFFPCTIHNFNSLFANELIASLLNPHTADSDT